MDVSTKRALVLVFSTVMICCFAPISVEAHARFIQPPSRASMWRYGFDNPPDYQDNEGFCGGADYQHNVMGGKCGICGDPFDQNPREHEVGGKYANGIIVDEFEKGQVIEALIDITANHLGYFVFRLCPVINEDVEVTQECLDRTPLEIVGAPPGTIEWHIGTDNGIESIRLKLPAHITCDHCVLQWIWTAGNNWGICEDGTSAPGCGPQENFRACADIRIRRGEGGPVESTPGVPTTSTMRTTTSRTTTTSSSTPPPSSGGCENAVPVGPHQHSPGMAEWCSVNCAVGFCPSDFCTCLDSNGSRRTSLGNPRRPCQVAVPVGIWSRLSSMNRWCQLNCASGYCPPSHCRCEAYYPTH
ncbi:unnamed protein product [Cyprideis torosa]|uniref:Uncharacterized protein n=1 Tax=Cyprideis torosa TaxID=163714 RepID=A0A7R8ZNT2_9CRUS|nr:unnamed protein product [Cyprideis torosa]CAG0892303.1 unnamed protein product [Cyprideis torosa]